MARGGHLGPLSYVYGYRGGIGRRSAVEMTPVSEIMARWNELISPGPCPQFDAIVPGGVLTNSPPPYTAPIAVYVAQRHQMAAAVHGRNRAQMRPSGEIARMAHPTQPMATDRVRGRSRTRISPHPSYSGYIGGSTEFHGLQEAKIGHFGGFRRSGNRFEMRWICGMGMYPVYI